MIKLKEGQKILGEDGNQYLIEKGDTINHIKEKELSMRDFNQLLWDLANNYYDSFANNEIKALLMLLNEMIDDKSIIINPENKNSEFWYKKLIKLVDELNSIYM